MGGLGSVRKLMCWVGLGEEKWTHVHLSVTQFHVCRAAIGCADLRLGGNVVVRRDGHLAMTVSCNNRSSSIRHHLVCKDRQWTGDLPMCPDTHYADDDRKRLANERVPKIILFI